MKKVIVPVCAFWYAFPMIAISFLVGILCLIFAILFFFSVGKFNRSITGTVVRIEIPSISNPSSPLTNTPMISILVVIEYVVDGKTYIHTHNVNDSSTQQYHTSQQVELRYSSTNPEKSMLANEYNPKKFITYGIVLLVVAILSFLFSGIVYYFYKTNPGSLCFLGVANDASDLMVNRWWS